jgi:DNA-binding XRE family transcriptional regulator
MLKQIKKQTNLKGYQLAQFLEVSEPTIYAWEKKNTWPLWALEKCGFEVVEKESGK